MLQLQYYYNFIESIAYFIAAIVPLYFILKSRDINNHNKKHLKNISIALVIFILIQGFYHIAGTMGFKLLAKGILEPLSVIVLLFFGLIYLHNVIRERKFHKLDA
ncbi:MAG: hypothetical protein M3Z01_07125 [Thermoproteota archaeon]|nr:hypothetical protein [Thermoproteota archaeon]